MSATHAVVDSPVGELTLVASSGVLSGLYFAHHWYRPDPATFGRRTGGGFEEATAQLARTAIGRNPLSVLVPCHRVLGKDGKLTGYAGGLRRKRFLLDLERSHVSATGSVYLT